MILQPLIRRIRGYFHEPASAVDLAMARWIVLSALLYVSLSPQNDATRYAHLPEALRVGIWGGVALPVDPFWTGLLRCAFLVFTVMAWIGLQAPRACFLTAVTGIYVLGVPQMMGKINHYHHLLWFVLLLSASPCSDRLSADSWLRRIRSRAQPRREPSEYGSPIRWMWLLMGTIYFFAGLAKLLNCGAAWFASDNLRLMLHDYWHIYGFTPVFRLDQWPLLFKGAAFSVICFELSFLPLMFFPNLRRAAAAAGLLFHFCTYAFMRIPFTPLLICYATFVDWGRLLRRFIPHVPGVPGPSGRDSGRRLAAAGMILLAANAYAGFRQIDSWPVSVYPTFAYLAAPTKPWLDIRTVNAQGDEQELNPKVARGFHPSRWAHLMRRIAETPDLARQRILCGSLWVYLAGEHSELRALKARFYAVTIETEPEKVRLPPADRRLVLEAGPLGTELEK